ncbi:MAG: KH domain-containing protein [Acutalibacteraceae bacterium]
MEHMGSDAVPHAMKTERTTRYLVDLVGENLGILIGRRGRETLDAIQHLANYAVNRGQNKRVRINVDAENYRLEREAIAPAVWPGRSPARSPATAATSRSSRINAHERHVVRAALPGSSDAIHLSPPAPTPAACVVVAYQPLRSAGSYRREAKISRPGMRASRLRTRRRTRPDVPGVGFRKRGSCACGAGPWDSSIGPISSRLERGGGPPSASAAVTRKTPSLYAALIAAGV